MKEESEIDSGYFSKSDFFFSENFSGFEELYSRTNSPTLLYMANRGLKRFTIKALKEEFRSDPFYLTQLRKEFEIGYLLDSPYIAKYYTFKEIDGYGPCIVREWIDGKPLSAIIKGGKTDLKLLKRLILEICEGLEYLHCHGVVHLDLKPSNIIVTNAGSHVKIIDFGLSDTASFTLLKIKGGTQEFSSPEQKEDRDTPVSFPADIYSLGKILELFPASRKRELRKLISRMTSPNPNKRPEIQEIKNNIAKDTKWKDFVFLTGLIVIFLTGLFIGNSYHNTTENNKKENKSPLPIELKKDTENIETPQITENEEIFEKKVDKSIIKSKEISIIKEPQATIKKSPGKNSAQDYIPKEDENNFKLTDGSVKGKIDNDITDNNGKANEIDVSSYIKEAQREAVRLAVLYYESLGFDNNWREYATSHLQNSLNYELGDNEELKSRCMEVAEREWNNYERDIQRYNSIFTGGY